MLNILFDRFEGDTGDEVIYGNWKKGKLDGYVTIVARSQTYACDLPEWSSTYSILLQETVHKYSGQYKDGMKNGFGLLNEQTFVYNEPSSLGQFIDKPSSETYMGSWKDGQRYGFGRYLYSNGDIFEGEWMNDKRNGKGLLICNDGIIKNGIWQDDELQEN